MKDIKPYAVIYDGETWIVINEVHNERGDALTITNKGLNQQTGWSTLLVNTTSTTVYNWDCGKHCTTHGIVYGVISQS